MGKLRNNTLKERKKLEYKTIGSIINQEKNHREPPTEDIHQACPMAKQALFVMGGFINTRGKNCRPLSHLRKDPGPLDDQLPGEGSKNTMKGPCVRTGKEGFVVWKGKPSKI